MTTQHIRGKGGFHKWWRLKDRNFKFAGVRDSKGYHLEVKLGLNMQTSMTGMTMCLNRRSIVTGSLLGNIGVELPGGAGYIPNGPKDHQHAMNGLNSLGWKESTTEDLGELRIVPRTGDSL